MDRFMTGKNFRDINGVSEPEIKSEKTQSTLFFLSFDLVNSTEFKNRKHLEWPEVFSNFYMYCKQKVEDIFGDCAKEWKKMGDEILYCLNFHSVPDVADSLPKIYYILNDLIKLLEGKDHVLSVKATFWAAIISEISKTNRGNNAQTVNLMFQEYPGAHDFIGVDIDFGFRIASKSAPGIICIDPKIISFIEEFHGKQELSLNFVKQVDLVLLKGVWHNRYVPIYWYHPKIKQPEKIFPFDEFKRNELVQLLLEGNTSQARGSSDILKEVNEYQKVKDMKKFLSKFSLHENELLPDRMAEVHLVAVLINKNKEIFCAKRSKKRRNLSDKWEFGCAHFEAGKQKIDEILKQSYENNFSIKITKLFDHPPNCPVVIRTYGFHDKKSGRWIPGFIFLGIGEGKPQNNKNEHTELKWLSEDEANKLNKDDTVEGFHDTVKEAFVRYTELFSN